MSDQLIMRNAHLGAIPDLPPLVTGCVLERAREEDATDVAHVLRRAFDDPSWDNARVLADLLHNEQVDVTYVLRLYGVPVATASAILKHARFVDDGYVHMVGSDPMHRSRRYGYLAALAVLHHITQNEKPAAVLETDDVRLPAIRTYIRLGFEPHDPDKRHAERWSAVRAALRRR